MSGSNNQNTVLFQPNEQQLNRETSNKKVKHQKLVKSCYAHDTLAGNSRRKLALETRKCDMLSSAGF